jgi:glycosyltransferase involved in cell wall biosynthesis
MRILEICNHFPPTIGGSETHNFSAVKYLYQQGCDVEVIAVRSLPGILAVESYKDIMDSILADEFTHPDLPGVHIHNVAVKFHGFPQNYISYFHIWQKIRKAEKDRGPFDVIEIHSLPFAMPISSRRKIVLAVHSFEIGCVRYPSPAQCRKPSVGRCNCVGLKRYLHWRFNVNICLPKIDKIIVKYDYMKRNLVSRGVPENKIALIPHWIDYEEFQNRMQSGLEKNSPIQKPDVFTFGFLGRLDEFKGILLIMQALKLMSNKGIKVHLLVIGDGLLRSELEAFCKQNGLMKCVTFAGNVVHDKVPSYLSLVDAFVVGSPYDNYNWSLLELMCTKKPIIATNTGGTSDILVDGYNAFLADPTPGSISEKMKILIFLLEYQRTL